MLQERHLVLQRLTKEFYDVFKEDPKKLAHLAYKKGATHSEIAECLGISRQSVLRLYFSDNK